MIQRLDAVVIYPPPEARRRYIESDFAAQESVVSLILSVFGRARWPRMN